MRSLLGLVRLRGGGLGEVRIGGGGGMIAGREPYVRMDGWMDGWEPIGSVYVYL